MIKNFIKKAIIIFIIFCISTVCFVFLVHYTLKVQSDFSLDEENKFLIFGHSHPAFAFNDVLIDNFKNLAKSGEGYFYTYQKVKEILSQNKPKAIFIEYSNNVLEAEMNQWIWGYETMNTFFPWHSPFMSKDDLLFLNNKNSQDFPKVVSTSTRSNFTRILLFDYTIGKRYGGYEKSEESNVAAIKNNENDSIDSVDKTKKISFYNINYLEKIVEHARNNNCKIFLIRSPQHPNFLRTNEKTLQSIKDEKFKNIEFLDFDKFPLHDNAFLDYGHLNHSGANEFSTWFNDMINNGLLSKKNKSLFIANEIEKYNRTILRKTVY